LELVEVNKHVAVHALDNAIEEHYAALSAVGVQGRHLVRTVNERAYQVEVVLAEEAGLLILKAALVSDHFDVGIQAQQLIHTRLGTLKKLAIQYRVFFVF